MLESRRRKGTKSIELQQIPDEQRVLHSSKIIFKRDHSNTGKASVSCRTRIVVSLCISFGLFRVLTLVVVPPDLLTVTTVAQNVNGEQSQFVTQNQAVPWISQHQNSTRRSIIPKALSFTHYINLLDPHLQQTLISNQNITNHDTQELLVLRDNVKRSISILRPDSANFLTDNQCAEVIQKVRGPTSQSSLARHFATETEGMYKADICRGAILYEQGGIYLDVDVGVRMNLFETLQDNTTFATVLVHRASKHPGGFFQAFIATTPRNPIILRYLELFEEYYEGRVDVNGPLGVMLLRRAYDDVVKVDPSVKLRTELWQEVKYEPSYQKNIFKYVPPPVWGTRRACKFVVVTDPNARPLVVPMYSRIGGSRMCPSEPKDTRYIIEPNESSAIDTP